jgi:hypothetical protein
VRRGQQSNRSEERGSEEGEREVLVGVRQLTSVDFTKVGY